MDRQGEMGLHSNGLKGALLQNVCIEPPSNIYLACVQDYQAHCAVQQCLNSAPQLLHRYRLSWSMCNIKKGRNVHGFASLEVAETAKWPDKYELWAQSNELTRVPPEIIQHFRLYGEFTSAQERCMSWILAILLVYPNGEEGDNFLVQIISTCRRYA
jgi:hypothetical protein